MDSLNANCFVLSTRKKTLHSRKRGTSESKRNMKTETFEETREGAEMLHVSSVLPMQNCAAQQCFPTFLSTAHAENRDICLARCGSPR